MKSELIVVANASQARVFKRESRSDPLLPVAHLEHPGSRKKSSDLADDSTGHATSDHRRGGVSFEGHHTPHEKEALKFAHEVAHRIDDELAKGDYRGLLLFASSPFLGELRAALSEAAHTYSHVAVDIDLTRYGLSELEERIGHQLHQVSVQRTLT